MLLAVSVRFPSCPDVFAPQQYTRPLKVNAHAWLWPAAIFWTPDESPTTLTGNALDWVDPLPSCPDQFDPQHATPWFSVIAQVNPSPTASPYEAPRNAAGRGVGVEDAVGVRVTVSVDVGVGE